MKQNFERRESISESLNFVFVNRPHHVKGQTTKI